MSWTLFVQILVLVVVVGAVGSEWIKNARRDLPPKGTRFVNVGKDS